MADSPIEMRTLHARAAHGLRALFIAVCVASGACLDEGQEMDSVGSIGLIEGAIISTSIRSIDGAYGSGCVGRASGNWSLAVASGAVLQYTPLTVAAGNTACVLTLRGIRTSDPTDGSTAGLYTAGTPITLGTSYAATSQAFSSTSDSLSAVASLSSTSFAGPFTISILVSDWSASLGTRATYLTYTASVSNDTPVSYWRLDEAAAFTEDDFAGSSAAQLQTRSGAVGATWAKLDSLTTSAATYAYISNQTRVRMQTDATATYYASGTPTSANYTVQADLYVKSQLGNDQAYVTGRSLTSAATLYVAGWIASTTAYYTYASVNRWELGKMVNGTYTVLANSAAQTLTANTAYNVVLEMSGTSIKMFVNGSLIGGATDSAIAGSGRAGLMIGRAAPACYCCSCDPAPSDTQGLHIDNLHASYLTTDGPGTNDGQYLYGVTLGTTRGALTSDTDNAATFDGVDDYVVVDREIQDDFSIEFWFKSTQGIGASSVTQWYNTAGLVDGDVTGTANDFGVGLRSDGHILAGIGNPDATIVSTSSTAYNDGNWHHVVFTRTRTPSALALYVDGVANGTTTGSTASLTASTVLNFGRHAVGNNYFAGSLDEVAVYSHVLSAATVLKHHQAGLR